MAVKRLLFGLVALCATFFSASAQYDPYWQWAKADTLSALNYSGASSVLGVKNGKALWGRMTTGQTVVNGTVMGAWTFTEYDSSGNKTNSVTFGGKAQMIDAQADASGNWYILGRFYDSLVVSTGAILRPNPAGNPDADHFVLRLDAGSFYMSWFKLVSKLRTVSSRAFTVDNSKIIIALDSSDATYVSSMSLSTGTITTLFRQGGPSTTTSILSDAAGNIYMAGACANKGYLDFNGNMQVLPAGKTEAYIARYLFNYAPDWHYVINDPACAQRKLSLFKDQFLYYTGTLNDSLSIGSASLHAPLRSLDFVSARLDPVTGAVIWLRQVDTANQGEAFLGNGAFHATVTPDTALVIFSQANTYVNWGNNITTNLNGTYSSVIVSNGPAGETRWARPILAENVTDDRLVGEGNAVWVCGSAFTTTAVTRFDTLNLKMPARLWVPYMGKLKLIRPPYVAPQGVAGNNRPDISASPNPGRNAIRITGLTGKSSLILRDMNGRTVLEQNTDKAEAVLNVAELPRGAYFLQLRGSDGIPQVRKIVLE